MRDIRIAAAQFEHRDGDKAFNLGRIRDLAARPPRKAPRSSASTSAACTAYTFLQRYPATSSTPSPSRSPTGRRSPP